MYINETGLPSVTDIISPYLDTQWFTEESRERGTAVHAAAATYLQGLFGPSLDPAHRPYFESLKKWIDKMVVDLILVEDRLIDEQLGFTGKPDLIARLRGDTGLTLIDFKTGQTEAKWYRLQNAAYRHLATKRSPAIQTDRGLTVRCKSDGSGCLIKEYGKSYRADMNIFISALNCWKFFN